MQPETTPARPSPLLRILLLAVLPLALFAVGLVSFVAVRSNGTSNAKLVQDRLAYLGENGSSPVRLTKTGHYLVFLSGGDPSKSPEVSVKRDGTSVEIATSSERGSSAGGAPLFDIYTFDASVVGEYDIAVSGLAKGSKIAIGSDRPEDQISAANTRSFALLVPFVFAGLLAFGAGRFFLKRRGQQLNRVVTPTGWQNTPPPPPLPLPPAPPVPPAVEYQAPVQPPVAPPAVEYQAPVQPPVAPPAVEYQAPETPAPMTAYPPAPPAPTASYPPATPQPTWAPYPARPTPPGYDSAAESESESLEPTEVIDLADGSAAEES